MELSIPQDTVIALEALTKYAMQAEEVKLREVTVTCDTCNPSIVNTVNNGNRLVTNGISVGESLTSQVIAQGHGCVIAQCSVKYNIPEAKPSVAFNLKTSSWPLDEPARCKVSQLQMCISYAMGESNMAVVEVDMPSGYKPELLSLDELENNLEIDLKRYEVEDNKINLYFDYFDQNQKCFTIRISQDTVVTNPKPANVKVYDYYQTELTTSTSYSVCQDTLKTVTTTSGI